MPPSQEIRQATLRQESADKQMIDAMTPTERAKYLDRWAVRTIQHSECVLQIGIAFTTAIGSVNNLLRQEPPLVNTAIIGYEQTTKLLEDMHSRTAQAHHTLNKAILTGMNDPHAARKMTEAFNFLDTATSLHKDLGEHLEIAERYFNAGFERRGELIEDIHNAEMLFPGNEARDKYYDLTYRLGAHDCTITYDPQSDEWIVFDAMSAKERQYANLQELERCAYLSEYLTNEEGETSQ